MQKRIGLLTAQILNGFGRYRLKMASIITGFRPPYRPISPCALSPFLHVFASFFLALRLEEARKEEMAQRRKERGARKGKEESEVGKGRTKWMADIKEY